jgi:hypothetical protein
VLPADVGDGSAVEPNTSIRIFSRLAAMLDCPKPKNKLFNMKTDTTVG